MQAAERHETDQVRSRTPSPTSRRLGIRCAAVLGYLLAAVCAWGALAHGAEAMGRSFLAGLWFMVNGSTVAAAIFLGAKFAKDAAILLADIGDSMADTGSRTAQGR